jgi:NAD(P)-dependent dehydrogenase (short-subunit alcohol dehydrogenase family)
MVAGDDEDQIAYRRGERHVARLVRRSELLKTSPAAPWKTDGSYLLTGGLGGLGLQVALSMAEAGVRDLILVQRSSLPPRSKWSSFEEETPVAKQIAAVKMLESKGSRVHIFSADVAREDQLKEC